MGLKGDEDRLGRSDTATGKKNQAPCREVVCFITYLHARQSFKLICACSSFFAGAAAATLRVGTSGEIS